MFILLYMSIFGDIYLTYEKQGSSFLRYGLSKPPKKLHQDDTPHGHRLRARIHRFWGKLSSRMGNVAQRFVEELLDGRKPRGSGSAQ